MVFVPLLLYVNLFVTTKLPCILPTLSIVDDSGQDGRAIFKTYPVNCDVQLLRECGDPTVALFIAYISRRIGETCSQEERLTHSVLFVAVNSISCVQCTPSDPRCDSGNLEPAECDDSHSFCAMYRVFVGNCK